MTEPSEFSRRGAGQLQKLQIFLILLFPIALLAFAKSYFSGLTFSGHPVTTLVHAHTAIMVLWLLMLVVQPWLIQTRQFQAHRWVGRLSYVVAPLIVIVIVAATHESLSKITGGLSIEIAQFEVYTWGQLIGFCLTWALAIIFRKQTPLHMRFMISTVFAVASAMVFRLLMSWLSWVPGLNTIEGIAAANAVILTLPLLALIAADWWSGLKWSPYWIIAVVTTVMHVGYFTFAKTQGWFNFVAWFTSLSI